MDRIATAVAEALEDFAGIMPNEGNGLTQTEILEHALDALELDQHDGGDHADRIADLTVLIAASKYAGVTTADDVIAILRAMSQDELGKVEAALRQWNEAAYVGTEEAAEMAAERGEANYLPTAMAGTDDDDETDEPAPLDADDQADLDRMINGE